MGAFTTIAGWIEIQPEALSQVVEIIEAFRHLYARFSLSPDIASLYQQGWVLQQTGINGGPFVFYGASVQTYSIPFIHAQVVEVSRIEDTSGYDLTPSGYFSLVEDGTVQERVKQQKSVDEKQNSAILLNSKHIIHQR